MKHVSKALNLAFSIAGSFLTFTLIGYMLDNMVFKTTPIFTIIGSLGGVIISFWYIYEMVKSDE